MIIHYSQRTARRIKTHMEFELTPIKEAALTLVLALPVIAVLGQF